MALSNTISGIFKSPIWTQFYTWICVGYVSRNRFVCDTLNGLTSNCTAVTVQVFLRNAPPTRHIYQTVLKWTEFHEHLTRMCKKDILSRSIKFLKFTGQRRDTCPIANKSNMLYLFLNLRKIRIIRCWNSHQTMTKRHLKTLVKRTCFKTKTSTIEGWK